MAQQKKLSVATVYGKIDDKALITSGKPLHVMTVYGLAVGTKQGDSNFGPWTALVGQFKAINPATGEISEASQLFLPDVALVPLQVALAQGPNRSVKFAIKLIVQENKNRRPGGVLYEYTFENVLPPAEDDPMVAIEQVLQEQKLLAAPESTGSESSGDGKGGKGKK